MSNKTIALFFGVLGVGIFALGFLILISILTLEF
jgi:hypothetical protein